MLSHESIWKALDSLARMHGLTPSGLARRSSLDPTSFNKSKRVTQAGRPRWPSTESLAKTLIATETSLDEFMALVSESSASRDSLSSRYPLPSARVPMLGFAEAGAGGFPTPQEGNEVSFPRSNDSSLYALEVSGDSMLPLYRDGDVVIVSREAAPRKGDRVALATTEGEVMVKTLARKTTNRVTLESLNPDYPDREIPMGEVEWIAKILWVSQ